MTSHPLYLVFRRQALPWFVLAVMVAALLSVVLANPPWPVFSRFFPLGIAGFGLGIAVLELGATYVPVLKKQLGASHMLDLAVDAGIPEEQLRRLEVHALGWQLLLLAGIVVLGFHVTVFAFLVAYCRTKAKASWRSALTFASAIWVVIFVVFDYFLTVPWLDPLLLSWFGR